MACITKRRDRWIIDFYDQHGKRRWKTLPEGTTKKAAKDILKELEDKVNKGIYIPNKRMPAFSEVADMWLKAKKPNIRESTHEQYSGHVENHLKPSFDGILINRIGYDQVEQFIDHCHDNEMNISTLKKILINLGAIMTYAVRRRFIDYNPVRDIEKPKGQSKHDETKDLNILNPSELLQLFDAAPDMKHRTIFMVAVTTGLRQGEILGLKWTDIDWFSGQVHVERTYNHFAFYDPKSVSSRRKVDIPPQAIKQLKEWRLACPPCDLDLVFPNEDGKPMSALNMFNRKFIPALTKAKLRKIRFHDLRHTYASIQIDLGANPKYIQRQMGHSSIRITLDTYGHLMKDVNQEAAVRLGDAIFKQNGSKMVAGKEKGASS
jgi:integrase